MPPVYRSSFGDLLEPGFRKIFDDRYAEIPQVFPSLFNMNSSSKQDERDSAVTGFGVMVQTPEGHPVDYEDPVQMYDVTYIHLKYTKGFKVSKEMWEDDLYNIMNKKPAQLGIAARRTREIEAAKVFNRAFNTSYLGGDAKPLASTTHPRADGGASQSNASATGLLLTEENLETGLLALRAQLDDKGQRIAAKADTLLVPPALNKTAHIIIDAERRSDSADNDPNVYKGSLKIIDWDFMDGSTTAWFLVDSSLVELNWFDRVKPEFKQDESFDTDLALFKSRQRFSRGWSDWRGIWGSKGDGAAYSD
jgi:phage major head subunit gpT-like protein